MSIAVMTKVWASSPAKGTALLVLLALADHADDDGNCYPSIDSLAAKCRMSTRNLNYILAQLQERGDLFVQRNAGPRGCNRYRLVLDRKRAALDGHPTPEASFTLNPVSPSKPSSPEVNCIPEVDVTPKQISVPPETVFPKPLKPNSLETSLNRQEASRVATRVAPLVSDEAPSQQQLATSRAKSIERPEDVTEQTWSDWLQLRKAKRAPVTATVLGGAREEAAKAGVTLEQFLRIWCLRGSQGLEAAWLRQDERADPTARPLTPAEARILDATPTLASEDVRRRAFLTNHPLAAKINAKPLETIDVESTTVAVTR